ncbi:FMRFamide receptor-like [Lineus longissimus]|uniref:FMRFamide receptor-like n=1 Tax=Lineus longissimus TaxID=88925 RepID=UPI002B4E497A
MTNQGPVNATAATKSPAVETLEYIYWVASYIYYVPTVIGVPGNIMSILVTMQKDNRRISTSVYMTALAVVDTLTLLVGNSAALASYGPLRDWLHGDMSKYFEACWYLAYTTAILSGFFLMEMTIDRLIVVRYPMAAARLCTSKRARWTVLITTGVIMALNANMIWIFKYQYDPETKAESVLPHRPDSPQLEVFASMFQLVFGTLLPFFVILTMNLWIIYTVKQAAAKQRHLTSATKTSGDEKRKQEMSHLTRMLILVSAGYVVCSIPMRIDEVVMDLDIIKEIYIEGDVYWNIRSLTIYVILSDLWLMNFAVNFYLYCIGGKKFRKDALMILKGLGNPRKYKLASHYR